MSGCSLINVPILPEPVSGWLEDAVWVKTSFSNESFAFSPDGQFIATTLEGFGPIGLVRVTDGRLTRVFHGVYEGNQVYGMDTLAFSPDGKWIVSGNYVGTIHLWEFATGKLGQTLRTHVKGLQALVFSSNGQLLASAGGENLVMLWNVSDGRLLDEFRVGDRGGIQSLAFTPDDQFIVAGGRDYTVTAARVLDGKTVWMQRHNGFVTSVSVSPDGQLVASASGDGTVKLWKIQDGS